MLFVYNILAGTVIYLLPPTIHSANEGNLKFLNQLILITLLQLFALYYPSFWKYLHILNAYITCISQDSLWYFGNVLKDAIEWGLGPLIHCPYLLHEDLGEVENGCQEGDIPGTHL